MNLMDFKSNDTIPSVTNQLWDVIHIIGATYQYTGKESVKAVKYFFDALEYILPKEYQENLKSFLKSYPIEKYFNGEKFQSFYWTYLYHDYINKLKHGSMLGNSKLANKTLTLEQSVKKYSVIDKAFWTKPWWGITHTLANYANSSCQSTVTLNRKKYMQLLLSYVVLLPCVKCRTHWNDLLKSEHVILHKILNGEEINVFTWSVYLHNKVNERLGKSIFPLNDARKQLDF